MLVGQSRPLYNMLAPIRHSVKASAAFDHFWCRRFCQSEFVYMLLPLCDWPWRAAAADRR
eukprot:5841689-Alexandrium_andersonii.AAC.1